VVVDVVKCCSVKVGSPNNVNGALVPAALNIHETAGEHSYSLVNHLLSFISHYLLRLNRSLIMQSVLKRATRSSIVSARCSRKYHASVLPSLISPASPEFREKANAMDLLVADLEARLERARQGGGPKAAERMRSRGKKLPRERSVS
jgi:hypothetical protein